MTRRRSVIFALGVLLALFSCSREEDSTGEGGIRFRAVGADSPDTKTQYEGDEDPTQHKERIDWIAGDMVRIWSNRAKAGLPPEDHADYRVMAASPSGLRSVAEIASVHDPLNWKSGAHIFYGLYPSPVTEDMDGYITFTPCDYSFEDNFKITCLLPRKEELTWTDDGDLHRGYPDMRHAYLWATQSAPTPTHDVVEMAFQPRFTAFEFVFTSSKIPSIHLRSFTLETTDGSPLFGTFTINNYGAVSDFTGTSSEVTYELDQTIEKGKYLSITLFALYKDISNIKITVKGDEILTRSLTLEKNDGTALSFPPGKKYRFINLDFPAVYAEGEGILWNERMQVLAVGEQLDWEQLQEILAHGADIGVDVNEDTQGTGAEDMKDPDSEDPQAQGHDMLPDNSGQTLTANFTQSPAVDFKWSATDRIAIHYNIPEASMDTYFPSSLTSGEGGTTATFQVSKSGVRDGYALYPGVMAVEDAAGTGGEALGVTLQQSWNVDDTPLPLPMIAVNSEGADLDFKALSGVLRVSLTGIPEGTKHLTLTTDRPICGEFGVDVSGAVPALIPGDELRTGRAVRLNFTDPIPAGGTDKVLDIPLPAGTYPSLIVQAYSSRNLLLGTATDYSSPAVATGETTTLPMVMDGVGSITGFTLGQNISFMAGQDAEELSYTIQQVVDGGGTEVGQGYTLSLDGISDPEVLSAAFTTDALTGELKIELTPLAVGSAVVSISATKGNVTLKATTTVTVVNISGIGFRASYPYVPLRNSHVEEAFPVKDSKEITGSFGYRWSIVEGGDLATIEGDSTSPSVRIKAGSTTPGDVVLRCEIYTGGRVCATATRRVKVIKVPEGTVNGLFTVEPGEAVLFASGNLTYRKSTGAYSLQEHQWSAYSGVVSANKPTDSAEDVYDVFRYECNSSNVVTSTMVDPFMNRGASPAIRVGSNDTYGWYLPTRRHFDHIFNGRSGAIAPRIGSEIGRYMFVNLDCGTDGVKEGMFIFPDCFEWPSELALPTRIGSGNWGMTFDTYTLDEFTSYLEPLGCVYLPGGHAAPSYDELGKENLDTKEKFYSRYWIYYDGSRGYFYSTFYNYSSATHSFVTPNSSQTLTLGPLYGAAPNRWFHARVAKRYEEIYAQ